MGLILQVAEIGANTGVQAATERPRTLPFAAVVHPREIPMLCSDFDYPVRQVVIDGEVWMIFVPGRRAYGGKCPVLRFKGPDLEHLVRLPDGEGDFSGGSGHLGCGMWWDEATRTLHGLIHSEYGHNRAQGWCSKKTRLATSRDLGLTWTLVGDVLTRAMPKVQDYTGACFEAGPADFDFYADTKGGYFYVTSWNSFVPKQGKINGFLMYAEVARCAIADKMAPGKWRKFRDGAWHEPGLGGKASRVGMDRRGIYGNTIYSEFLKKYLRIGINIGVKDDRGMPGMGFEDRSIFMSACDDLGKQDWAPMAKLWDEPGNKLFGFTLADAGGRAGESCAQNLRAYNYWLSGSRVLEITLGRGETPAAKFPPHSAYDYEPNPESGDRLARRATLLAGSADTAVRYIGGKWSTEQNEHYYQARAEVTAAEGQSIEFDFIGAEIYWRAVFAPDAGQADVFLDGVLQETVDLFFPECADPYEFAFVRTDLDRAIKHTIRIVTRGTKSEAATGTKIRHIGFEHSRT